jgi:flavin reductase (DIM6/NTAB) family NADH-FMN oxidoreductase RutF
MQIDPATLRPSDRYKLLTGAIVPRPIAWISTISRDGRPNLAPFSFFSGVGSDPMTVLFCPANNEDGTMKDTMKNALPEPEGTGVFTVNIVTQHTVKQMAATAEPLPFGESEFALAGVSPMAGMRVRCPRVAESPIALECRTLQVVRTGGDRPAGGNVVIGEVVCVHIDDALINERYHIDADGLAAVGRMAGLTYAHTRERFTLPRGPAALTTPLPPLPPIPPHPLNA